MEIAELEEPLRRWLGERYGNRESWTIEQVSHRGRVEQARRLFRVAEESTGRTLAVKANADPVSNDRQYRALRNLAEATADCVAPIALDEENRFFVMDWVSAPLLEQRLEDSDREAVLAQAGAWLARLQAATAGRASPDSRLHSVRRPPWGMATRRAARQLRRRVGAAPTARRLPVMIHGDFHPGNLFCAGSRVLAFDRKFNRHGIPYFDAARFLISVASQRERAAEAGRPWSGDADADRRSFFAGWGPLGESEVLLFDLIEDVSLFNRWERLAQRGDRRLETQMEARGLLGTDDAALRPGRLVVADAGGRTLWTREPVPEPRQGFLSRLRARWLG